MPRIFVLAAVALVAVGCADKGNDRIPAAASLTLDANSGTAVSTTSTSLAAGTGPAVGTAPEGELHGVGEAVTTASGNTLTLHAVDAAGAGPNRYAADVEACATSAARISPSLFSLELANGSVLAPVGDGKQPALGDSDLTPGACGRGWVTFQLPPDQAAVALVFRGSSVIRWSLA